VSAARVCRVTRRATTRQEGRLAESPGLDSGLVQGESGGSAPRSSRRRATAIACWCCRSGIAACRIPAGGRGARSGGSASCTGGGMTYATPYRDDGSGGCGSQPARGRARRRGRRAGSAARRARRRTRAGEPWARVALIIGRPVSPTRISPRSSGDIGSQWNFEAVTGQSRRSRSSQADRRPVAATCALPFVTIDPGRPASTTPSIERVLQDDASLGRRGGRGPAVRSGSALVRRCGAGRRCTSRTARFDAPPRLSADLCSRCGRVASASSGRRNQADARGQTQRASFHAADSQPRPAHLCRRKRARCSPGPRAPISPLALSERYARAAAQRDDFET
jgi:hypothetical protein